MAVTRQGAFDTAVEEAAKADRVGFAFAAGYRGALGALVPDRDPKRRAALAATEKGPIDARRVETKIDIASNVVTGEKGFITLGTEVDEIYVLANAGEHEGRSHLVMAEVDVHAPGLKMEALPALPFAPEIPHARAIFTKVPIVRVLPGDGWNDYVRPFRTIEDIYVHATLLAYLIARRYGWPEDERDKMMALLEALRDLSGRDMSSPRIHRALGGAIALSREVIDRLDWSRAPSEERARWERDRPLLSVAEKARALRLAKARAQA
jgi:acyl-CoA dehydrogenase